MMVREARFSRDDLEATGLPNDRGFQFDDDEFEDIELPRTRPRDQHAKERKARSKPMTTSSDTRRHLAGADWTGTSPAEKPRSDVNPSDERPAQSDADD